MADDVSWTLAIVDQMTAPLAAETKALKAVERAMAGVERELARVEKAERVVASTAQRMPWKPQKVAIDMHGAALRDTVAAQKLAGESMFGLGSALGAIAAPAAIAGAAIVAVGVAGVKAGANLLKFAVDAAESRNDAIRGLELIEGSAEKATATYERFSYIAKVSPWDDKEVVQFGKTLRSTGFDMAETERVMAGLFDVAAVQGDRAKELLPRLLDKVVEIKSLDVLTYDNLKELSNAGGPAGLNVVNILNTLAKQRNTSVEQVRKLISAGQIKGNESLNAILATVQRVTNKGARLGTATEIFGTKSLKGAVSSLESAWERLFSKVDTKPLIRFVQKVTDLLDENSPAGKKIARFTNDVLGKLFSYLDKSVEGGGLERTLNKVTDAIIGLSEGFLKAFGDNLKITEANSALAGISDTASKTNWKEFGGAIGMVASAFVNLANAIAKAFEWSDKLLNLFANDGLVNRTIFKFVDGVADDEAKADAAARAEAASRKGLPPIGPPAPAVPDTKGLGVAAGDGVAQGLIESTEKVNVAAKALATSVKAGVSTELEIHSPSRVMQELGEQTAAGFEIGLNDGGLRDAVNGMALPEPGALAGGSRSVTVRFGDVIVSGANAREQAEAFMESIEPQLLAVFERLDEAT